VGLIAVLATIVLSVRSYSRVYKLLGQRAKFANDSALRATSQLAHCSAAKTTQIITKYAVL